MSHSVSFEHKTKFWITTVYKLKLITGFKKKCQILGLKSQKEMDTQSPQFIQLSVESPRGFHWIEQAFDA